MGEPVAEYLQEGFVALLEGNGFRAIHLWEDFYNKYPSVEVCCYLARAHFYQIFLLKHHMEHPAHYGHLTSIEKFAFLALRMQENSATAHALASIATCMMINVKGWNKADSFMLWQARFHGEKSMEIENNPLAHLALGLWHRGCSELTSLNKFFLSLNSGYTPNPSIKKSIYHFQAAIGLVPENNIFLAELALSYIAAGAKEKTEQTIQIFSKSEIMNFPAAKEMTTYYKKKLGLIK